MAKLRDRDESVERVTMSFRPTPQLRATLEAAAVKAGRSLAQEAEWRLERQAEAELDDPLLTAFMEMVPRAVRSIETVRGKRCSESDAVRDGALAAIKTLADMLLSNKVAEAASHVSEDESFGTVAAAFQMQQWANEQMRKAEFNAKFRVAQSDALAYRLYQVDREFPEVPNMTTQARNARRRKMATAVRETYFVECADMTDAEALAFAKKVAPGDEAALGDYAPEPNGTSPANASGDAQDGAETPKPRHTPKR